MPLHISHTPLAATPEQAYDYLTIPSCWHEWHAASLGTVPDARVSQPAGATFEENIRTAGFRRRLHWRVTEARRPSHWQGEASMSDGSRVYLRYDFAADGDGTRFTRTLNYTVELTGAPVAGEESTLEFEIFLDGHAVTDIPDYLGARGHLVALRDGDLAYLHVHADEERLAFEADFPTPGAYRLFLQFRHGDAVHTAAFTVDVSEETR